MFSFKKEAMPMAIANRINDAKILAVLVIDDIKHVTPLVESLIEGGVNIIELAFRTPIALNAAAIIKVTYPQVLLGFGTIIEAEQVKMVVDAGADFAVAPGCNPKILKEADKHNLPFAPGIMTPSDIEIAIEHGCKVLKYFPAESSGGLAHLRSMVNPYSYLGLKFIPLGGCSLDNAQYYLESELVTAIGGSWIAERKLIREEKWKVITENAKAITKLIKKLKK